MNRKRAQGRFVFFLYCTGGYTGHSFHIYSDHQRVQDVSVPHGRNYKQKRICWSV